MKTKIEKHVGGIIWEVQDNGYAIPKVTPTREEYEHFSAHTSHEQIERDGRHGTLFTDKENNNSVFLKIGLFAVGPFPYDEYDFYLDAADFKPLKDFYLLYKNFPKGAIKITSQLLKSRKLCSSRKRQKLTRLQRRQKRQSR